MKNITVRSNLWLLGEELHGVFGMFLQLNVSVVFFFCRFPSNNQCSTHGKLTLVLWVQIDHIFPVRSFSSVKKGLKKVLNFKFYQFCHL